MRSCAWIQFYFKRGCDSQNTKGGQKLSLVILQDSVQVFSLLEVFQSHQSYFFFDHLYHIPSEWGDGGSNHVCGSVRPRVHANSARITLCEVSCRSPVIGLFAYYTKNAVVLRSEGGGLTFPYLWNSGCWAQGAGVVFYNQVTYFWKVQAKFKSDRRKGLILYPITGKPEADHEFQLIISFLSQMGGFISSKGKNSKWSSSHCCIFYWSYQVWVQRVYHNRVLKNMN